MKKFWFLIPIIITIHLQSQTLLFEENFDYSTGTLTSVSTAWSESPTGSVDIQVTGGSLSYTDYPSSGVGNKINLNGGASSRSGVLSTFTSHSGNGTTVYGSFIIRVTSTTDMDINTSDGDYFCNFKVGGSLRSLLSVRQGATSSNYQIGIGKLTTSTPVWYSTALDVITSYLVVMAYVFQSGDDAVRLWINPNLSGSEPTDRKRHV